MQHRVLMSSDFKENRCIFNLVSKGVFLNLLACQRTHKSHTFLNELSFSVLSPRNQSFWFFATLPAAALFSFNVGWAPLSEGLLPFILLASTSRSIKPLINQVTMRCLKVGSGEKYHNSLFRLSERNNSTARTKSICAKQIFILKFWTSPKRRPLISPLDGDKSRSCLNMWSYCRFKWIPAASAPLPSLFDPELLSSPPTKYKVNTVLQLGPSQAAKESTAETLNAIYKILPCLDFLPSLRLSPRS